MSVLGPVVFLVFKDNRRKMFCFIKQFKDQLHRHRIYIWRTRNFELLQQTENKFKKDKHLTFWRQSSKRPPRKVIMFPIYQFEAFYLVVTRQYKTQSIRKLQQYLLQRARSWDNVASTLIKRHDVATTFIRRCINTMCPLGRVSVLPLALQFNVWQWSRISLY